MNEVQTLSTDINVITAEINAYQRVAGEAIFEIGYRLKGVRDNPQEYGFEGYRDWERWCKEEIGMSRGNANKFIQIYEELDSTSSRNLGFEALYQIATLLPEQREQSHQIPSTGDTKTVDEMTVRELREVKAELKRKDAMLAEKERSEEILTRQNERLTNELSSVTKPETVVVEKEVERVVEVDKTDYSESRDYEIH